MCVPCKRLSETIGSLDPGVEGLFGSTRVVVVRHDAPWKGFATSEIDATERRGVDPSAILVALGRLSQGKRKGSNLIWRRSIATRPSRSSSRGYMQSRAANELFCSGE
ncbi:MAG: hypothetical protein Q4G03_02175 [Planctomycetia bacterium]|nr:hypothetical protein [Planctomycetia bacterium]